MQSSLSQFLDHFRTVLSSCHVRLSSFYHKESTISLSAIDRFIDKRRRQLKFSGHTYLWPLYLPIMWFFINPSVALAEVLLGIAKTTTIVDDSVHVPTFYAPITADDQITLLYLVLPVVAIFFGALHCIGWNFDFPSHIEQLLWRIGSLAITSIPFVLFVFGVTGKYWTIASKSLDDMVTVVLLAVAGFLLVGYMLARILLLTQAIVLLRKQPESAFYAINWSDFLPHV